MAEHRDRFAQGCSVSATHLQRTRVDDVAWRAFDARPEPLAKTKDHDAITAWPGATHESCLQGAPTRVHASHLYEYYKLQPAASLRWSIRTGKH